MTTLSGDSNHQPPQVQGYSFYLNVVLLSSGRNREEESTSADVAVTEKCGDTKKDHDGPSEVVANGTVTNPHELSLIHI